MSESKRTGKGKPAPKPAEPKPAESKERPPAMYYRLDDDTLAALNAFMAAQRVPPSQPSVGLQALHEFLEREGFWPPKR